MMHFVDIVKQAKEKMASDLHLTIGIPPMVRVHGELEPLDMSCMKTDDIQKIMTTILTEEQIAAFLEHKDLDCALTLETGDRVRLNMYHQHTGVAAAFRFVSNDIKTFSDLGLPIQITKLAEKEKGLVLVTGPTGSGKSTTLAAMIDFINHKRKGVILTIEDPIEFIHSHQNCIVNQREIGMHASSFSRALRSALREDPDVILVGELRDLETIAMAITAAETGHLVLASLHTHDSASSVDRLIDVFPAYQQPQIRLQVASILQGVVSQVLVKNITHTGRECATEIMMGTSAVSSLIREGKTHQLYSVIQTSTKDGMYTMDHSLGQLVQQGKITKDEALKYAEYKTHLETMSPNNQKKDNKGLNSFFQ